ncbi:MAG: 4-alpha-glucanotransferase [Candidatus Omnitrophota bacterium]
MIKKGSGIFLHISSLASNYGIGDLGPEAYKFADFLTGAKQKYWQVLPLNPTNSVNGNSPYSSSCAFAVNNILISPEILVEAKLIKKKDLNELEKLPKTYVDFEQVYKLKGMLFIKAFENFKAQGKLDADKEYLKFCKENDDWLDTYTVFIVFKKHFNNIIWSKWPEKIRDRDLNAVNDLKKRLEPEIEKEKFLQYLFFQQWHDLKKYCNKKKIKIIGDIPIYVTYDSADTWANPEIFKLDKDKRLEFLAGVPPDYFSKTGQLWGNPVYNWEKLKENNYSWWIKRIEHNLKLFDLIRIDHFRGFVDYWQVPKGQTTAMNGAWQKAPVYDFFEKVFQKFSRDQIIAEDLGIITDEVKDAIRKLKLPGMKILLFAFYEDLEKHPYLPHNFIPNCVAYTGTHDNNTARGWFENELEPENKAKLFKYLKKEVSADQIHWELIKVLMESVAKIIIIPAQDILGLGQEYRMNLPGAAQGNWKWRILPHQITPPISQKLLLLTQKNNRSK